MNRAPMCVAKSSTGSCSPYATAPPHSAQTRGAEHRGQDVPAMLARMPSTSIPAFWQASTMRAQSSSELGSEVDTIIADTLRKIPLMALSESPGPGSTSTTMAEISGQTKW